MEKSASFVLFIFVYLAFCNVFNCDNSLNDPKRTNKRLKTSAEDKNQASQKEKADHNEEKLENDNNESIEDPEFRTFASAFLMKRKEQKQIVGSIQDMTNLKKQEGFLKVTVTAIFNSLKTARVTLDKNNYQIGEWPSNATIPQPEILLEIRSALSSVVENFALFCDLVLFFPDYVQSRMKLTTLSGEKVADSSMETIDTERPKTIVQWATMVANVDQFIFTNSDKERTNLALQQLNLIPRSENFVNPHSKEFKVEKLRKDLEKENSKKNEKKQYESSQAKKNKKKFEDKRKLSRVKKEL